MEKSANYQISSQIYARLDSGKREYRLLRFVGGKHELAWELGTHSLVNAPPFYALSHCWGKAEAAKVITLSGHEFLVRPSLYNFLVQMASENRRDWFFIDAICINQDDLSDRSVQVANMGDVYRTATEVIAWIYFDNTFDPRIRMSMTQEQMQDYVRNYQALEKLQQGGDIPLDTRQTWEVLLQLIRQLVVASEYWSRLWVVQELLLAKKLTIQWYSLRFDWENLIELCVDGPIGTAGLSIDGRGNDMEAMRKGGYDEGTLITNNTFQRRSLWHWYKRASEDLHVGRLLSFPDAFQNFSINNCSVIHDNVYALLGISICIVQPDCSLPLLDLYVSTLYQILLSLWSMKPAAVSSASKGSYDVLRGLGLDPMTLRKCGRVLFYAFQIQPFDELIFLATFLVVRRFASEGGSSQAAMESLAAGWVYDSQYVREGRESRGILKKPWYLSENQALKRINKGITKRVDSAMAILRDVGQSDKAMTATAWSGSANDGRTKRVSEWVRWMGGICAQLWDRWTQNEREQTMAEQIDPDL
ncbi:hypothetical protein CBER1_07119 [Cercospora berteroae]|uniref:Heterokaryon incompatibility domain-containing protein n=1 Tax=Cercospora berteroae TaxID=357750 RepID=A0A2S6C3R2_9PEZI|nr:hypothetical protein CBER1_07119 [Cercospora berteroae]